MITIEKWVTQKIEECHKNFESGCAIYSDEWRENLRYGSWGVLYSRCPKISELIDDSNFEAIEAQLNAFDPDGESWANLYFGHWASDVESLLVELLDSSGAITPIATLAYEIMESLERYPVLDDDDFSRREWEQLEESFDDAWRYCDVIDTPENKEKVWQWIRDNAEDRQWYQTDLHSMFDENWCSEQCVQIAAIMTGVIDWE